MINRLISKIKETNAPIVVGLDPTLKLCPEFLKEKNFKEYGANLKGASRAMLEYNKGIIDAVCDLVPCVKPQIAMYETFGTEGVIAFKETIDYAKSKGLIVLGDIKRGDIGSTSEAYALGHLSGVEIEGVKYEGFSEDFATVNPYLGIDGIKPFIDVCAKERKGIFVLVKTSNPSSKEFQDRLIDGKPLYEHVARKVDEWGASLMGDTYSYVGAVVGATYPEIGEALRKVIPKAYILVPGYGAQGGTADGLRPFFNEDGLGAIVNSSRGIIAAYKSEKYQKYGEAGYQEAARRAVIDMKEDINRIF